VALIDDVKKACGRLGPRGWSALLQKHGLDIGKDNLGAELARSLPTVDRTVAGFEDFAAEGTRGIEPGMPARSLLYHAFASPNVRPHGANEIDDFPTLAEIEAVENYVFGVSPRSIVQLRALANGPIAIVVFACEYRPAPETVHRRHADLCFSRTGVARVGTKAPLYDAARRGFLPFDDDDREIRVLPARYAAYVAVEWTGAKGTFGPMNARAGDDDREFWVPLHKLFSGDECVRGHTLAVRLDAHHVNEKLRRLHLAWDQQAGWTEPALSEPPFVITEGIAELSQAAQHGRGLLVPVPQPLVEAARHGGELVTYRVPAGSATISSSLYIPPSQDDRRRPAPEFVHARHRIHNGELVDLNDRQDVRRIVEEGGYDALHYVDYTGDGFVAGVCPELATEIPRNIPAYSLVTAPDFFVNCDQRELGEWFRQSVREYLRLSMWAVPPDTLADQRLAPNLNLTPSFVPEDKTVTAIVSLPLPAGVTTLPGEFPPTMRHSCLPDAAAGVFDPGWDVSRDRSYGTDHLAAYGLGSPFPEDAKLCAALSTFWPAVAPDAARAFQPNPIDTSPTVAPLLDDELAWDGAAKPTLVEVDGVDLIEYDDFDHVDYVQLTLERKFTLARTGRVDTSEYQRRVLAMARAYRALGIKGGTRDSQLRKKAQWTLFSMTNHREATAELDEAIAASGEPREIGTPFYRFEMYRHGDTRFPDPGHKKIRVEIRTRSILFVDALQVLVKQGALEWRFVDV
jgi:hypothetical protein